MTAKGKSKQFPNRAAIVDAICARLAQGEGLAVICRDEGMPHFSQVYRWRKDDPELDAKLDLARKIGFDAIAESCIDIADAADEYKSRDSASGKIRDPQRDKLRVWTRLQLLSKWDPKRYGERMTLAGDKNAPLEHRHTMTDAELEAIAKGVGRG